MRKDLLRSRIGAAFHSRRRAFIGAGFFSCCINMLMLTGPLFMLQIYDRVLTSRSIPTLVALLILVIGLFAFMGLLEIIRSRILVRIGAKLDEHLGSQVFDKVLHHSLQKTPNINSQPLRDLDSVRQFLSGPGPFALFDTPWVPVYLGVIFLLHTWLGLFACAGALLLFGFALLNEYATRRRLEAVSKSTLAAHAFAEENRRNAEVVQAMGMASTMRERWQDLRSVAIEDHNKASDRSGTISAMSKAARMLLQSMILALGAYLAVKQEITAGSMIAASIIMSRALSPLEQSIMHWRGFLNFRRAYKRLKLIFNNTEDAPEPMQLPEPIGRLEVNNIIAAASGSRTPILQGVNFSLEVGHALGVIGPTGSGKSTLARVLVGVWPALKGSITIDSAPLEQWNPEQIGPAIGYLPQDIELFSGTVEENISRFSKQPDPEGVIRAAQLANVHDLILQLPDGYNTKLGEGGATLSGGQRQRIALARALYGDPVFVVLDEPNSNLDMEGEVALVQAITTLKSMNKTVVVIAHRPSAINSVDYLLYMQDGRQTAFGPKEEILQKVTQQVNKPSMTSQVTEFKR